jgi:hypothetical protein
MASRPPGASPSGAPPARPPPFYEHVRHLLVQSDTQLGRIYRANERLDLFSVRRLVAEFIHFLIDSQTELVATTYISLAPTTNPVNDFGGEELILEEILVVFLGRNFQLFLKSDFQESFLEETLVVQGSNSLL